MKDMIKFKETLDAILEVSKAQNNTMSMSEIKGFFEDSELTDEQFKHVFDYLTLNHIEIENYKKSGTSLFQTEDAVSEAQDNIHTNEGVKDVSGVLPKGRLSKKEEEYIEHYRREIRLLSPKGLDDAERMVRDAVNGSEQAKKDLLDAHLLIVADIVTEFCGRGIPASDLIQEGNMGLMSAVDEIMKAKEEMNAETAGEIIRDRIKEALHLAVNEDYISKEQEQIMLHKVTKINDAAKYLAEEYMRLATVHEIAEYTRIPEEDIINIIKLSKEDLGVRHDHEH